MSDDLRLEDAAELHARVIEAESLVKVLRRRCVADQTTIQRAAEQIHDLQQQLAEAHDAYDQLARLLETTSGQTAAPTDQETPCPPPTP